MTLNVLIEGWLPGLYDPEYATRLKTLRMVTTEHPDRPLLLVVGSSRTAMNFCPGILPPLTTAQGKSPLVFNFSHLAAGPLMNLVQVQRLLHEGLRPTWLVVEVMLPQLGDDRQNITTACALAEDVLLLQQYHWPWRFHNQFLRNRLSPCYRHRQYFLHARWLRNCCRPARYRKWSASPSARRETIARGWCRNG